LLTKQIERELNKSSLFTETVSTHRWINDKYDENNKRRNLGETRQVDDLQVWISGGEEIDEYLLLADGVGAFNS
jgi:hypothetical protein